MHGLRTALTDSPLPHTVSAEQARDALRMVQLSHLEDRIDHEIDWASTHRAGRTPAAAESL